MTTPPRTPGNDSAPRDRDLCFYLGTHRPRWLATADVPLCISYRQLRRYAALPGPQRVPYVIDSGAYTELARHGRWTIDPEAYATSLITYAETSIYEWAATQDWPCEPQVLRTTGLSVRDHQHLTVEAFVWMRTEYPFLRVIPVLQGWTLTDHLRCVHLYAAGGVDLHAEPVVGLGSVCRRGSVRRIAKIVALLGPRGVGLRLHGFGLKTSALALVGDQLVSADSTAWSLAARYDAPLPGCSHDRCQNCYRYARRWRDRVHAAAGQPARAA